MNSVIAIKDLPKKNFARLIINMVLSIGKRARIICLFSRPYKQHGAGPFSIYFVTFTLETA
jgi:hypothetical protein